MNQAWLYRLLHLYLSFKNGEWGVWTLDLKLEKALFRESVILKFYDFFLTKISSFQNKETGVCWIYKFTEFKTQEKLEINLFCGCCLVSKLCLTFFFLPPDVPPVACQAPLSMGFPRQEYWSGLPFPTPGGLPDPGIKPAYPALQVDSLSLNH